MRWSHDLDDARCRTSVRTCNCRFAGSRKPHMHTQYHATFAAIVQGDLCPGRICTSDQAVCVYFLRNECGCERWRLATNVPVVYHLKYPGATLADYIMLALP
jgi:hypothetical protein